jgi:hypothetical protein
VGQVDRGLVWRGGIMHFVAGADVSAVEVTQVGQLVITEGRPQDIQVAGYLPGCRRWRARQLRYG